MLMSFMVILRVQLVYVSFLHYILVLLSLSLLAKTLNVRMHLNDFKSQYVWMSVMSTEKLSMEMSSMRILLSLHLCAYVGGYVRPLNGICVYFFLTFSTWCTMVRKVLFDKHTSGNV